MGFLATSTPHAAAASIPPSEEECVTMFLLRLLPIINAALINRANARVVVKGLNTRFMIGWSVLFLRRRKTKITEMDKELSSVGYLVYAYVSRISNLCF